MDNSQKNLSLEALIEAILFYTAEPMTARKLSSITKKPIDEVRLSATKLGERLLGDARGICLLVHDDEYALGTSNEASSIIEEITKEELTKELSKAALETLSIVCYKGPLTRADIDYIRGVNSTFILRNLLIRGIVEKRDNPKDMRSALYAPTMLALEHMGVTKIEDLPNFDEIQIQLANFVESKHIEENTEIENGAKELSPSDDNLDDTDETLGDFQTEATIAEEDLQGGGYVDLKE